MSSIEPLFLLELSKQSSGKTQEDIEYELEEQLLEEMRSRRLSDHESIQDHMIEMSPIITSESLKDIEQKYNEIPLLGSPILSSQTFSIDDDKKMNKEGEEVCPNSSSFYKTQDGIECSLRRKNGDLIGICYRENDRSGGYRWIIEKSS